MKLQLPIVHIFAQSWTRCWKKILKNDEAQMISLDSSIDTKMRYYPSANSTSSRIKSKNLKESKLRTQLNPNRQALPTFWAKMATRRLLLQVASSKISKAFEWLILNFDRNYINVCGQLRLQLLQLLPKASSNQPTSCPHRTGHISAAETTSSVDQARSLLHQQPI